MSANNMSIYVPHVFPNFDEEYIRGVFENVLGVVDHIDMVGRIDKNGKAYNAVYIHFKSFYDSFVAQEYLKQISDPDQEAQLVHDGPWYWILLENKGKKHDINGRKLRIDIAPGLTAESVQQTETAAQNAYHSDTFMVSDQQKILFLEEENRRLRGALDYQWNNVNMCHGELARMCLEVSRLTQELEDARKSQTEA